MIYSWWEILKKIIIGRTSLGGFTYWASIRSHRKAQKRNGNYD